MRLATLAEYLDVSYDFARKIVDRGEIPAIQHSERGDRYFLREDADAYLSRKRSEVVRSAKAA
jgi:excisionase family DNA binding protein